MAVKSLRAVIDSSFVQKFALGSTGSSSSSTTTSSSNSSVNNIRSSLRTGAATFAGVVQSINSTISVVNTTKETLEKLQDIVEGVITVADKAASAQSNSSQRKNLNAEFKRLGKQFQNLVKDSTTRNGESVLSKDDLENYFASLGLDSKNSETIATLFDKFRLTSTDSLLASETEKATRPVRMRNDGDLVSGSGTFSSAVSIATTAGPRVVASGDFNNDGIQDLVTTITNSNVFDLFKGNGDGTFQTRVSFATGLNPVGIKPGDIDGDGNLDLVVASSANGGAGQTIDVYMGNGNGTFATRVSYSTPTQPAGINLADMDHDNDLDMIVASGTGQALTYYSNQGNGTFAAGVSYATTNQSFTAEIADLDSDGNLDMITAGTTAASDRVNIFYGNGNGTFEARATLAFGGSSYTYFKTADVNNDAKVDFLLLDENNDRLRIALGNGNGTFQTAVSYSVGEFPQTQLDVGDVNGDGISDLLITDSSAASGLATDDRVNIMIGNGNGTFQARVSYSSALDNRGAILTDLNNDNVLDVVNTAFDDSKLEIRLNPTTPNTELSKVTDSTNIFDSERNILSRANATLVLKDSQELLKQIKGNIKVVNEAISLLDKNMGLARATGFAFLEISQSGSSNSNLDTITTELQSKIREKSHGSLSQLEFLDPLAAAYLTRTQG